MAKPGKWMGFGLQMLAMATFAGGLAVNVIIWVVPDISKAVLLTPLWFGLLYVGAYIYKYGRRMRQPTAAELLSSDNRQPILLLRSFQRDHQRVYPLQWSELFMLHPDYYLSRAGVTFEEKLFEAMQLIGPVVALGRPGEQVQPAGASRAYTPDSEWQEQVRTFAQRAALVVMVADDTPALRWELREMASSPGLARLLLALPPDEVEGSRKRPKAWYEAWSQLS